MALWIFNLARLYTLFLHIYIPNLKSVPPLFLKIYPLKCIFYEKMAKNSHYFGLQVIYRAMELKRDMLVYSIIQHVHVHLQVSTALHYENMADFVICYNKNDQKLSEFWSVKYTYILQLNDLKF